MIATDAKIRAAERALAVAQRRSDAATARRAALPPGSSRARVTTANARWSTAAEHRDRCAALLEDARAGVAVVAREPAAAPALSAGSTVTLGRTTYIVFRASPALVELRGPRGGETALAQNRARPQLWGHIVGAGTVWYRRGDDGSFARIGGAA